MILDIMVKMMKHKKPWSFKVSKLKNLLGKPWNPSEVTRICDPSKPPAPLHHSFKLDSKLKYLRSTAPVKTQQIGVLQICTNKCWIKARWISDENNNVYKMKRKQTLHMLFFTNQILKAQKHKSLPLRETVYSGISKLIM